MLDVQSPVVYVARWELRGAIGNWSAWLRNYFESGTYPLASIRIWRRQRSTRPIIHCSCELFLRLRNSYESTQCSVSGPHKALLPQSSHLRWQGLSDLPFPKLQGPRPASQLVLGLPFTNPYSISIVADPLTTKQGIQLAHTSPSISYPKHPRLRPSNASNFPLRRQYRILNYHRDPRPPPENQRAPGPLGDPSPLRPA